jgi:hypothetical protein
MAHRVLKNLNETCPEDSPLQGTGVGPWSFVFVLFIMVKAT